MDQEALLPESAKTAPAAAAKRSWYAQRFSLRTLMIVTTLASVVLGLVVAPVSFEVQRALSVSRTTYELQSRGALVVHHPRTASHSLRLARALTFGRFAYLGKEIAKVDCGDQTVDLATIPRIDTLEEIHFRHFDVTCSDPRYQQPSVRLVHYWNLYPPTTGFRPVAPEDLAVNPHTRLLRYFPNVETVRLLSLHPDAPVLQDLPDCKRLRRLEVSLFSKEQRHGVENEPTPWDGKLVRDLKQLTVLHVDATAMPVDWSFLATMPALREVRVTGCNASWKDAAINRPRNRDQARQRTPLYHLAKLPKLHWLSIRYAPSYSEDLAILAAQTPMKKLQLDDLPDGPASLSALQPAAALRSLHLRFKQFEGKAPEVERELQNLPQLNELICTFSQLKREQVELLTQLKQIETFRVERIDGYDEVQERDLEKLLTLRFTKFPGNSQLRAGRELHDRANRNSNRP